MTTKDANTFRNIARDCQDLAQSATDPIVKDGLAKLSQIWLDKAEAVDPAPDDVAKVSM